MDISLKIKADKLGKDIENLAESVESELNNAVSNLANAAYTMAIAKVQAKRLSNEDRESYINGLTFKDLGNNSYIIVLDGNENNKIEEGRSPYDMKEKLLSSKKTVSAGPNAGKPWVKISKKGNRYAHVPFEHKPYAASSLTGNLESDILNLSTKNNQGVSQKLTQIFKDEFGKPLSGKVASMKTKSPEFNGLTKYQHVYESGAVQSVYLTFRTISDVSSGWKHPGSKGLHIFKELEQYVESEMENILKVIIK